MIASILLCLTLTGCAGPLVDALDQREVASCIWWRSPFGHGVSVTGGASLEACLAIPCQLR